jgi:hypothetical protein
VSDEKDHPEPAEPVKPAEPAEPAEPAKPVEASAAEPPAQPAEPPVAEPVRQDEPASPAEPAVADRPGGTATATAVAPAPSPRRQPPRRPRARFWRTPGGIAAVVLLALVVLLAIVELSDGGDGDKADDPAAHVAVGAANGRSTAAFDLLSGAASVTVRAADTGGDLYRVATPVGTNQLPKVVDSGDRIELQLVEAGGGNAASHVEVLLSRAATWSVRLAGGAADETVDLSAGKVSEVDLVAGVTHIDLALPAPHGTVPVRLAGGASDFSVSTPPATARRVTLGGGAGSVQFVGTAHNGVSAGQVFDTPGWAGATDKYDLQLSSGVSLLTVSDRR